MHKRENRGFTLVELLVVIAVIALLLSILMPALRRAKDQAMKAQCSNSIHQQLIGFLLYAQEYDEQLFGDIGWLDGTDRWKYKVLMKLMGMSTEGGIWEDYGSAPITQKDITAPDVFFCPSNTSRRGPRKQCYWDFDVCAGGRASWRIIGFLWILENDPWANPKVDILGDDNKKWVTRLDMKFASLAELITDIAYSDRATGRFDIIISGGSGGGGPGMAESSSHVQNAEKLFGINVGFCDGHVSWRPFNQLQQRWAWGSGPINWW